MNAQLFRIENPKNSPLYFRGCGVDILYVITRNRHISDLFGEHQKGYIYIDEIPNQEILNKFKYIKFMTENGNDVLTNLPSWIYQGNHISALSTPIDLLSNSELINSDFYKNLETLELTHSFDNSKIINIDCAKLTHLKRLIITAYNYQLINTEFAKNMEIFSINLEDRTKDELAKIKFLPQVKFLQLESISTKLDLSSLSELKLTGLSIKFNFHKKQSLLSIIDMSELEYLFINNIAMPIDFKVFSGAKKLKEITIWNSKKFENIPSIGNIQSLKALEIAYCKLNLTDEEKILINNMNLDYLKIV